MNALSRLTMTTWDSLDNLLSVLLHSSSSSNTEIIALLIEIGNLELAYVLSSIILRWQLYFSVCPLRMRLSVDNSISLTCSKMCGALCLPALLLGPGGGVDEGGLVDISVVPVDM